MKIEIKIKDISLEANLFDSETAKKIFAALPIEGIVNTWGDEIYFEIPVEIEKAPDALEIVEVGDLGYWPTGRAFCIFFGPTPASTDEKPRAASPVNVFGRVLGNPSKLTEVEDGTPITITAAD